MYQRISTYVLVLSVFLLNNVDAGRILVLVPTPSISHQVVFRALTQELARRGHDVTYITTDPAFPKGEAPENLTEIDTHDISYGEWRKVLENVDNGKTENMQSLIRDFTMASLKVFEAQMKLPEIQDIIKNKNSTYDVLIVEAWVRFALGFAHVIKAPVIAMSSLGALFDNYETIGAPIHPVIYPEQMVPRAYNLTLWEKMYNFYNSYIIKNTFRKLEKEENDVVRSIFGQDTPPLSELQNKVEMLFLNIHPIWEGNRPVPPSVIHIGGLHQKPQKELPQDLKKYLDNSKHGVIYMSFGTNVETSVLPADKIQAIINVFSEFPYDVLWKWNGDVLPGQTKNIKISKWLPQSDLLRHPNVKLFITQGGLQSTDESITAGVPLIGIPMIGDQWFNSENYVHHRIGMKLELATLEEEAFKRAIETIIGDSSYRENIVRLRTLMHDQPMSSLERAVWWTEHVLRHGGARHLRAPAANMPLAEYYELELVLVVLSVAIAVIVLASFIIIKSLRLAYRKIVSSDKVKTS